MKKILLLLSTLAMMLLTRAYSDPIPGAHTSEYQPNPCDAQWNSLLQSPYRKLNILDTPEKPSISVAEINILSARRLLAVEEGIILKNGNAYLRSDRGGGLRLFHDYIPVWSSSGRHFQLVDSDGDDDAVYFQFTELSDRLMGENREPGKDIATLTLTKKGNLLGQNQDGETIWESNTFMAEADDVLANNYRDDKAPNSVIRSNKAALEWASGTRSTLLLKNGSSQLRWDGNQTILSRNGVDVWSPPATGWPVWQANGALAIYNGAPYFTWGSSNWVHGVVVGNILGISDEGSLMITDNAGCIVWEEPRSSSRSWSALKSRKMLCKRMLTDRNLYQWWNQKNPAAKSFGCPKGLN